jgi:DNA polymerase elongation subunit (family B)
MFLRIVSLDILDTTGAPLIVRVFLRAKDGSGWCLDLHGFRPHMHIDAPPGAEAEFIEWLSQETAIEDIDHEAVEKQSLYGYQGNNLKPLLRLSFRNEIERKKARRLWFPYVSNPKERTPEIHYNGSKLRCYEANVPAVIQFLHKANLQPSGIVKVDPARFSRRVPKSTALRPNHYKVAWQAVVPTTEIEACSIPLRVDSYDIEASSSHGDFPVANKNYSMTAREIIQKARISKREDRDVDGWLRAALGIGPPVRGISLLELKEGADAMQIVASLQRVLRAPCPAPPRKRELSEFFGALELARAGEEDDVDSESGESTITTRSMAADAERAKTTKGPLAVILSHVGRKEKLVMLTTMLTQHLPPQKGDMVTYIGVVAGTTDPTMPRRELCFCLPKVSAKNANCELVQCETEKDLLLAYARWQKERQADLVIGYNIFGFDEPFLNDRSIELGCQRKFLSQTLNPNTVCADKAKGGGWKLHETTITLASGPHCLRQIRVPGTVKVDLFNHFRKTLRLESYSLNFVAGTLLGGEVCSVRPADGDGGSVLTLDDAQGVVEGGMIALTDHVGDIARHKVLTVRGNDVTVEAAPKEWEEWGHAKDDVEPKDIFRLSSSGIPEEATLVANYCKQDCALVYGLFDKVDIYTELTEMSNISQVPLEFLILRGQGIKLTSLLVNACNEDNRVVEDICKEHPDEPYEGAEVLDPIGGIYRDPVTCLDYSSLYPSADISDNVSHETKKWAIQYDMDGMEVWRKGDFVGPLAPGHHLIERTIPTYKRVLVPKKTGGFKKVKMRSGNRKIGIVQYPLGEHGMMPRVLASLLAQREATRKRAKHRRIITTTGETYEGMVGLNEDNTLEQEDGCVDVGLDDGSLIQVPVGDVASHEFRYSDFIRNIFDKRQLTYKVLANSLYGGTGAVTSAFYEIDVAALITAIGRAMLKFAKAFMEGIYKGRRVVVAGEPYIATARCVYGDTDSVFVAWAIVAAAGHSTLAEGTEIHGKQALPIAIGISQQAEKLASNCLRKPHTLEYEKTFMPWILLTAKRYAGDLYEKAVDRPKLKSMGVMLRRRDNAQEAKRVYKLALKNVLHSDIRTAFKRVIAELKGVISGKPDVADLIVSKSLRSHYDNPETIAHKVLADRIAERDPGNAPRPGDRVPYVYINNTDPKASQGDRIELPEVAGDNIDYRYYVDHQMLKPIAQLFACELEKLPNARKQCKAAVFREGASLAVRSKAVEKMITNCLVPPGQRSIDDFFG